MEDSQIASGRRRPRKTIREITKKYLERLMSFDRNMVYDRTL
jgi:hypothetical protein